MYLISFIKSNAKRSVQMLGSSVGLVIFSLISFIILGGVDFVFQSFKTDFILDLTSLVSLIMVTAECYLEYIWYPGKL